MDLVCKTSPETFWFSLKNNLIKNLKNDKDSFHENYTDNRRWTNFMTQIIKNDVATDLQYTAIAQEYWPRMDIAFFDTETNENWDKWALEIGIEIENNPKTWYQECHKLMMISCGLKVLIGYKYNSDKKFQKEIDKIETIYTSRKYNRLNDKWLLIFGPMDSSTEIDRDYYVYKMENIKKDNDYECKITLIEKVDIFK